MTVVTDYVTVDAMKVTLDLGTGTTWDADLGSSITTASRTIDGLCNRRFYLDADANQTRYYTPRDTLRLEVDDVAVLTTLQTDSTGTGTFDQTWTLHTDFELEPLNAQSDSNNLWPYTHIQVRPFSSYCFSGVPRSVRVTAQFGWASVPQAIVEGTTLLAERLFKMKREAPLGVLAFQDVAIRVARTDPNLQATISRYMKHAMAVA